MLSDVEVSRALNAVLCTLRERRPDAFDPRCVEEIARGALGGESKLRALRLGEQRGELRGSEDDRLVAEVSFEDGRWQVQRKLAGGASDWATPGPGYDGRRDAAQPS